MGQATSRVLILDENIETSASIEAYLTKQGIEVMCATNAAQMDKALEKEHFQLLLLDLSLSGEDGISVCRRLRQAGNLIPIVMKTTDGDEIDRIIGLEIGADDFLPEPCSDRELLARIKAVIRRNLFEVPTPHSRKQDEIKFGQFTLNLTNRQMYKGDTNITLTSSEFAILRVFSQHPSEPLSREKLASLAKGNEHTPSNRAIDVQISRLRRLIEDNPAKPLFIQTVWGLGYVFIPETAASPIEANAE